MPRPALQTTRRATLAGLLATLAVSGCDTDDLRPPERDQPAPEDPSGSATPDSDAALVDSVVVAILGVLDLVGLARRRFPQLEETAGPLARLHRGHLGVLQVGAGTTRTSTRVPSSPSVAMRRLRTEEQRLQRVLAQAAVDADSGALARLLASMSAAVAQHVAVLPAQVPDGGRR